MLLQSGIIANFKSSSLLLNALLSNAFNNKLEFQSMALIFQYCKAKVLVLIPWIVVLKKLLKSECVTFWPHLTDHIQMQMFVGHIWMRVQIFSVADSNAHSNANV